MSSNSVTYLFVPASRPDRFARALTSGADVVIVDLEDSVAVEDKDTARGHLMAALENGLPGPVHVRLNATETNWFTLDLQALTSLHQARPAALTGVVVPKAEDPASLRRVRDAFGHNIEVVALIESAAGLCRLRELGSSGCVSRLAVGAADLSFDLDIEITSSTMDAVYAQIVLESRLAGLPGPIASPPFSITDPEAIGRDAERLRGLGATGQMAIHPAQLSAIDRGFLPSAKQVEWARRVVTEGRGGATQVDGQMVDKPVRERAEQILARAVPRH